MSDISPIQRPSVAALNGVAKQVRPEQPLEAKSRQSDRVELSDHARYLSQLKELPPIREELVSSVRAEIQADRYETEARIDAAIEGLIEDLGQRPTREIDQRRTASAVRFLLRCATGLLAGSVAR